MDNTPLKEQAQGIITAVERDLEAVDDQPQAIQTAVNNQANTIVNTIFNVISDVDIEAANNRVKALKADNPNSTREELSQMLIREKCQRTGTVGAVTAGAGIIPGIGTAAAITLGTAADIGMTFKLQAELVLEIAALYDYPLTEDEKKRLVMVITGISAGTTALARKAGQNISLRVGEKFAERAAGRTILKAIPWVGILASAGTNVLSTYIIGHRADTYFRVGPEAVGSWADTLRTVSGLDERRMGTWLVEGGRATGAAVAGGAAKVGAVGKTAGSAVLGGAGKMGNAVGTGSKKAGRTAGRGIVTLVLWLKQGVVGLVRMVIWLLYFSWRVISYLPRKIGGRLRRRRNHPGSLPALPGVPTTAPDTALGSTPVGARELNDTD